MIEALVTIQVMVILMAIAIPNFAGLIANNRATAVANELLGTLNFARSEAIKRGTAVTICKCANPDAATPACSTSAAWQDGWLVFTDDNGNGSIDVSDTRLRVGQPPAQDLVLGADTNFSNFLTYQSNGSSLGNGGNNSGNLTICVSGNRRVVNVSATGRVQITKGSC